MRKFQSMEREKKKKADPPADPEPDDDAGGFPEPNGVLVIVPAPAALGSRRKAKLARREV